MVLNAVSFPRLPGHHTLFSNSSTGITNLDRHRANRAVVNSSLSFTASFTLVLIMKP